jgi:hypothetical protein
MIKNIFTVAPTLVNSWAVWHITVALGDVVALEFLPPGTAAWFCTKDKYNLPMFSYVCQAETKAQ